MSSDSVNILFNKFEIIDCLKKDDFGSVYLATHIYLNKKIVLKVLDKNLITDEGIIERFKREAKILAKLDHPNIIKVLDFGLYESFFYISVEYFESSNLRHLINSGPLDESEVKNLSKQLLLGLEFAHRNKIIHRDIKPENIFVDENHLLKIGDFGLAFSLGDKFVTHKASVVGTPAYMSPEQVQGDDLDEKSDLFSLGVVIYELLSGKSLFISGDINLTINKILNFDSDDLSIESIIADPNLSQCIIQLLQSKKNDRPENALAALNILGYEKEEIYSNFPSSRFVIPSSTKIYRAGITFLAVIVATAFIYFNMFSNHIESPADKLNVESDSLQFGSDAVQENNENIAQIELENNPNISTVIEPIVSQSEINEDVKSENNTDIPAFISPGSLSINVIPWAYVYVDSQLIDSTPIDSSITLSAGKHELILKNPGYPDFYSSIYINEKEKQNLSYSLDTLFSYLKVNVYPWGSVTVNGEIVGDTPLERPIVLRSGKHDIRIVNPELGIFSKEIELIRGDTLKFTYNFSGQKLILN